MHTSTLAPFSSFSFFSPLENSLAQQPPVKAAAVDPHCANPLSAKLCPQVSCGPFHTCAVSSGGRLFSWGDGLCGKLGHGHSLSCAEPRQVAALADQTVLHVACGVWHTACIARPHQAQDQTKSVKYLEGPSTGSSSFEDSSSGVGSCLRACAVPKNPRCPVAALLWLSVLQHHAVKAAFCVSVLVQA